MRSELEKVLINEFQLRIASNLVKLKTLSVGHTPAEAIKPPENVGGRTAAE